METSGTNTDAKNSELLTSIFPIVRNRKHDQFSQIDSESNIKEEKQRIEAHPLFPLLEMLLIKSEELTSSMEDVHSTENDIKQVVKDIRSRHSCLSSGDPDLDSALTSAIRVLRIHLVELGKVNDLCKEFCERYTSCIKTRINQETLLGFANDSDDEESITLEHQTVMTSTTPGSSSNKALATMQTAQGTIAVPMFNGSVPPNMGTAPSTSKGPDSYVSMPSYQPSLQQKPSSSTSGSMKSLSLPLVSEEHAQSFFAAAANEEDSSYFDFSDGDSISSGEGGLASSGLKNGSNNKRTSLPRKAVDQLRSWLFQHVMHPYPSENEKRQLAKITGLNLIQVNNWFINARRRILQPMLEGHGGILAPKPTATENENGRKSSEAEISSTTTTASIAAALSGDIPAGTSFSFTPPSSAAHVTSSPPAKRRPVTSLTPPTEGVASHVTPLSANGLLGDIMSRPLLTSAQRYWPLAGIGSGASGSSLFGTSHLALPTQLSNEKAKRSEIQTSTPIKTEPGASNE